MNELQRGLLSILRSAVTDAAPRLENNVSLEEAAKIAKKHRITTLFYYGVLKCGVDSDMPLMKSLFRMAVSDLSVSENQKCETDGILSAFDKEGIDHMPLKGILLKGMYPKPEMRPMGDVDILIRVDQYARIKPIMLELGFTEKLESNHEYIWVKGLICIELHKMLIPSYNEDYYDYFGDGWRLAKCDEGSRYALSDEDQLVFLFTHFAKHYRDAGIGLRHAIDIWLYKKKHPTINEEYVIGELKKLRLDQFYVNIDHTLKAWFDGGEESDMTDFITAIIFNSGVYGTSEAHMLSAALKNGGKTDHGMIRVKALLQKTFPSYGHMSEKHPLLKKIPFLLPMFWFVRIFKALLFMRREVEAVTAEYKVTVGDRITEYQQALHYVGLDFNFEEKE